MKIVRSHIVYIVCIALSIFTNTHAQELVINEVMTSNIKSHFDQFNKNSDWIEIYNSSSDPIYLGHYFLSDDASDLIKWRLPEIYLTQDSHAVFYAGNSAALSNTHTNFNLASGGEQLFLSNQYGLTVDQVEIPELKADISYGRQTDGGNTWGYFEIHTVGASNQNATFYPCLLKEPELDKLSGSHSGSLSVPVSHDDPDAEIRYNVRGNDPSQTDQLAIGSVLLNDPSNSIDYSGIPTNPAFNYPQPGYTESRANNRGWAPPY